MKPDGSVDYDRYYTLFAVQDGKLMAYHFVFDGTTDFENMTVDGNKLSSQHTFKSPSGETIFNQSVERVAPDRLHWNVTTTKDGQDKQLMDGIWVRQSVK